MRKGTNEGTYTTTKHITTLLLRSRVKRKRSVRTGKDRRKQPVAVEVALQTSLHRYASSLHFLLSTAYRMLKHDLGYHAYKLQIVQELKETNFIRWKGFYKQFLYL